MIEFETLIKVRYVETDQMGIANHSNYFAWFEAGRTEFIKLTGFQYREVEKMGILLPLSSCSCVFYKKIEYEDEIIINTRIEKFRYSKIVFAYRVFHSINRDLLAEGQTIHGFVDKTLRPVNLKKINPFLWDKINRLSMS